MGKKSKSKRGLASTPRGLPVRGTKRAVALQSPASSSGTNNNNANPFEVRANKRLKHTVLNRYIAGSKRNSTGSALAMAVQSRRSTLKLSLQNQKKKNAFVDNRIGENATAGRRSAAAAAAAEAMTEEEKMLRRIVKERVMRSRRSSKFDLNDDDDDDDGVDGSDGLALTHRGRAIDESYTGKLSTADDVLLSDSDEDDIDKTLSRADTEMHFGGGRLGGRNAAAAAAANPYGPSNNTSEGGDYLGEAYRSRKTELDELIHRRKTLKAERLKSREDQLDTFEHMDEQFAQLTSMLQFRDNDREKARHVQQRRAGTLPEEEKEMDEWQMEMKGYLFERKVKATDRTKTPEEAAQEEAERLHELEKRRLARMSGDFDEDDLSDVESSSDDDEEEEGVLGKDHRKRRKGKKKRGKKGEAGASKNERKKRKVREGDGARNPDELDSDDDGSGDDDEPRARFTADGLVYVDKEGNVVRRGGRGTGDEDGDASDSGSGSDDEEEEEEEDGDDSSSDSGDDDSAAGLGETDDEATAATDSSDVEEVDDEKDVSSEDGSDDNDDGAPRPILPVGTKVKGNYRAKEQFEGHQTWYAGVITRVGRDGDGNAVYDVEYDDGDFEENMEAKDVKVDKKEKAEKEKEKAEKVQALKLQKKKKRAKQQARKSMPFVFEVPTTLEALHDMIATLASTGKDASTIVQRIHAANSVRLNKTNKEKMQNFYDVLLRRYIAVGDAIFHSGDGGPELGRHEQLNCLTKTLYAMSQDSPDCAGAVWRRRLGIFQKALAKRLRDSELLSLGDEGECFTAWPSMGTFLLLRALGHIFPVTDLRHSVVTPALLFLGQTLAQAPVRSIQDAIMGILCAGLMIEYTREAKRIAPEALAFVAGVARLFSNNVHRDTEGNLIPSLAVAVKSGKLDNLRDKVLRINKGSCDDDEYMLPRLSLENMDAERPSTAAALLCAALHLMTVTAQNLEGSLASSEAEALSGMTRSLLLLKPKSKNRPFPGPISLAVARTAQSVAQAARTEHYRLPLRRRCGAKASEIAVKSFAPRMEDPKRYVMSKDKGKSHMQAQHDKYRREYKREHKAAARELRLDAAFIENERRMERERRDIKARERRHKNFAWLEQEQATINQQVRQGGGLLKGGGIGTARAKAASAKLGMKKGGKMG